MQAGAVDFLEKSCPAEILWESIRNALERDRRTRRRAARRRPVNDRLNTLDTGQRAVLDLVCQGNTNRQIADYLGISVRAVEERRSDQSPED